MQKEGKLMKAMYYVSLDSRSKGANELTRELTRKANEDMLNQNFKLLALAVTRLEERLEKLENARRG